MKSFFPHVPKKSFLNFSQSFGTVLSSEQADCNFCDTSDKTGSSVFHNVLFYNEGFLEIGNQTIQVDA